MTSRVLIESAIVRRMMRGLLAFVLVGCSEQVVPVGEPPLRGPGWTLVVPDGWERVQQTDERLDLTLGDADFTLMRTAEDRSMATYRQAVMATLPVGAISMEEPVGGVAGVRFAWNEVDPIRQKRHRLVAISGGKRIEVECTLPENRAVELFETCERIFAGLTVR